ncbi:hypothetical protein FQ085_00765 [Planococcus sp. ANT_H30]|uniref:hypothetical protein n=1 Tax=Planococcus sp. ANT_H30 TaxID=2597347 RepID=UPI0011EEAA35|nr:hypothetical protein [Planococcus sp. ANT_H30]KAA0958277.1 hypothetical protein FQ085_00765 [Planococcus sp. ANT_H30]
MWDVETARFVPGKPSTGDDVSQSDLDALSKQLADMPADIVKDETNLIYLVKEDGSKLGDGVILPGGADGWSAYQIAVGNGFAGSEVDWIASLKGEQGIQGSSGTAALAINDSVKNTSQTWSSSKIDSTKANKVQDAWITPTALSGWTSSLGFLGFYKDSLGIVRVQGSIATTSLVLNSIIFILPEGYRPSSTLIFTSARTDIQDVIIYVETGGSVRYVKGGASGIPITWASLSSVSFRAIN